MKFSTKNKLRGLLFVSFLIAFSASAIIFAGPAMAGGGKNCNIKPDGGGSSGSSSSPAALKVVFLDANGAAVTSAISYKLESTNGKNIAQYSDNGYNHLGSAFSIDSQTCARTDGAGNFDIWYYRHSPVNGYYDGNGYVLFCKNHPAGDPNVATADNAVFRIIGILALPAGGGAGGGQQGQWVNTAYGGVPSGSLFGVINGSTITQTFKWIPDPPPTIDTTTDTKPNLAVYPDCINKRIIVQSNDVNAANTTANLSLSKKIYQEGTAEPEWSSPPNPVKTPDINTPSSFQATWYFDMSAEDTLNRWIVKVQTTGVAPNGNGGAYPAMLVYIDNVPYGPCSFPIIKGRVYDGLTGAGISGVTISCNNGILATTNANGNYEFTTPNIAVFTTYCLRPTLPAGSIYKTPAIVAPSDWRVGSDTAPPYPGDGNVLQYGYLLYCYANSTTWPPCTIAGTADESYEHQVAAGACYQNPQYCGAGKIGTSDYVLTHDRATDEGMDFVYELINPPSFPWLQTTGGSVVGNGQIIGQVSGTKYSGSRNPADANKEAEFLIISKVGGGGPFCSRKNYILTNASATGGTDCGNGSGYSALNVASVAGSGGADDKVVAGVKDAYDALPQLCKITTTLVSNIPTSVDSTTCPNGMIVKFNAAEIYNYKLIKGRITILVENDIVIGDFDTDTPPLGLPIQYGTTGYDNPKDVPNLVIVVKGDAKVDRFVRTVDASIYATGAIYTCAKDAGTTCSYQLTINGFLSAQSGFIFGRGYTNTTARTAAEKINLTLQSVVFPPPGIDYGSVFKGDSSIKIDSSEYQPKF